MQTTKSFLAILAIVAFFAVPAGAQRTYVAGYQNVYYFNPLTGGTAAIPFEPADPYDMVITADGLTAYLTLWGGNLAVIDVMTNKVVGIIPTAYGPARAAIGNGGTRLYVTNNITNEIIIVNIAKNSMGRVNKVLRTVNLSDYAHSEGGAYAIRTYDDAATNTHLLAAGTYSGEVYVFDTTNSLLTYRTSATGFSQVSDLVFSKDGTKLYIMTLYESLFVADARTLSITKRIDLGGVLRGALQPNGARLFVTGWDSGVFFVVDTVTDTLQETIPIRVTSGVGTGTSGSAVGIAISNLGAAHGGLTIFMTDYGNSRVYMYHYWTKTMLVMPLEGGASPFGIAVTDKNWQAQ